MRVLLCCNVTLLVLVAFTFFVDAASGEQRLWDQEPTYWQAAQGKCIEYALPKNGPYNPNVLWIPQDITTRYDCFRLNNKQLKVSLWGAYDELVLSLGKTDVWDRRYVNCPIVTLEEHRQALFDERNEYNKAATKLFDEGLADTRYAGWLETPDREIPHNYHWKAYDFPVPKPVGQVILSLPDLAAPESAGDEAQPATAVVHYDDGTVRLNASRGDASAQWTYLTMMTGNVVAIDVDATGLRSPATLRLFRHQDICVPNSRFINKRDQSGKRYSVSEPHEKWDYSQNPEVTEIVEPPKSGRDGRFFWISQRLPAEKTFPEGFQYVLMGLVTGTQPDDVQVAKGEQGLGRMGDDYRDQPGWAATAVFPAQDQLKFTCLLAVATSVDGEDVFAIAKKQLLAAEKKRMSGLIAENADWYRGHYEQREHGRIFDGSPDRASQRIPNLSLSWVNQHSRESDPDPYLYEADAWYGGLDADWSSTWHNLSCYNELYFTHYAVMNRLDTLRYQIKFPQFTLEASRRNARDIYGLNGAFGPAHGFQPPAKLEELYRSNFKLHFCTEVPGQFLKCAWDAWDYGGDEEVLREYVYPPLREQAIFVSEYVSKGDDGRYHVIPSMGGEHWGWTYQYKYNKDNTAGVAMFKWALLRAAEAAEHLGVDEDRAQAWRDLARQITPFPTWQTDEGPVFTDAAGVNPIGRVYNNAIVAFPTSVADLINLDSDPEQIATMLRTAKHVWGHRTNRQVYHLLGQDPNILHHWWPGVATYHWSMFPGGYWGRAVKEDLFLELDSPERTWDAYFFEPERLCNSRSGRIHLFPCVPDGATVAFRDFLARGGFEVSAEMIDGQMTYLEITPRRDNVCTLVLPGEGDAVEVTGSDGKRVAWEVDRGNGFSVRFNAQRGVTYRVKRS